MKLETAKKPQVAQGIMCPHCGHNRSRVLYTRPVKGGRLRRRRKCLACGRRITTYESIERP